MKKYTHIIVVFVLISIIIALSPVFSINMRQPNYFQQDFEDAKVIEVLSEELVEDPIYPGRYTGRQVVKVKILTGEHKGKIYEIKNPLSRSHNVHAKENGKVIVSIDESQEETKVWIYNYKRDTILYAIIGIFFLLLIILGRIQGLNSIMSLIFTGVMIAFFMLPLIFQGSNPAVVTIVTASIIVIVSFILISGFKTKSFAAIVGTIMGIIIAGSISFVAGELAQLSGITMDKGKEIVYIAQDYTIQVKGLMFSAILIASLGAVMDVAMSISSSIYEVHQANPRLNRNELFKSGMNIGKDVMGTMSNTLILAFTGGSLNSIMLIWGFQMKHRQFMNIPFLGTEIIQGISGSIGIILTVPITAFISSLLLENKGKVSRTKSKRGN